MGKFDQQHRENMRLIREGRLNGYHVDYEVRPAKGCPNFHVIRTANARDCPACADLLREERERSEVDDLRAEARRAQFAYNQQQIRHREAAKVDEFRARQAAAARPLGGGGGGGGGVSTGTKPAAKKQKDDDSDAAMTLGCLFIPVAVGAVIALLSLVPEWYVTGLDKIDQHLLWVLPVIWAGTLFYRNDSLPMIRVRAGLVAIAVIAELRVFSGLDAYRAETSPWSSWLELCWIHFLGLVAYGVAIYWGSRLGGGLTAQAASWLRWRFRKNQTS